MTLRTIDIPQADGLALVRKLLEAVGRSPSPSTNHLSELTGFSERHVRYRATARILDLVSDGEDGATVTTRGRKLLRTIRGSPGERKQLRRAVEDCAVIREIAPSLLAAEAFDFDAVTKRIMTKANLSQSTAERRAQVLRAWRRQLI